jgi:hypothetical protein
MIDTHREHNPLNNIENAMNSVFSEIRLKSGIDELYDTLK